MSYWNDQITLHGITVRAAFDPQQGSARQRSPVAHALPFLRDVVVTEMFSAKDRQNFYYGNLLVRADAVFAHGDGLICVRDISSGRMASADSDWQRDLVLVEMLECLVTGYTVAQNYMRSTACVLRIDKASCLLVPDKRVVDTMLDQIPAAMEANGEAMRISGTQLASFSEARIFQDFPRQQNKTARRGRARDVAMSAR